MNMKKMGKWTQPPCLAIFDETVPGHGWEESVVDTQENQAEWECHKCTKAKGTWYAYTLACQLIVA